MTKPFFNQAAVILAIMLMAGCVGEPMRSRVPMPGPDAGFQGIWAYAASLEEQVKTHAQRRWRDYPDGLRKAVTASRLKFMVSGKVVGPEPDLQSYLFFEYRRQKGLGGSMQPGRPDANTERYVRALLAGIRER